MGTWVAVCNIPGIAIGQIAFIVLPQSTTVLLVTGLIKGIGFGFPMCMCNSLIGTTIDYGEWKTGVRVQSILMAGGGIGGKIGQGVLTSLFGVFLTAVGYDGTSQMQLESAMTGIDMFFKYVPLVVAVAMLILAFTFDVEKKNPQIRKELIERRGELG